MRNLLAILLLTAAAITPARAQWTEPVRIGAPGGVLYPQILAQGDTLHVVYTNNYGGWKIGYVRSTDGGDTWSDQQVLSDTANTTQTRYPVIISNHGTLITLWLCALDHWPYDYNIGSRISVDSGLTWGQVEYVLDPGWTYPFYLAASGTGSIINIETSGAPGDTMIFYNIRSSDFGESWGEPAELFRTAQGGRPDQAASGHFVHYVWSGRYTYDEKIEIYYMRSTDDGANWSPNMALSDFDEYHSQLPAIAADDSGNVGATWMDFKFAPPGATGDVFLRVSADSGWYWTTENHLTNDHDAYRSDIMLKADTIFVVWEDASFGLARRSIYFSMSADRGVNWSDVYWLDGTLDESREPSLTGSNGNLYVVWGDSREDPGMGLYFSRYDEETGIVDDSPVLPDMTRLRAYPNPFNSNVAIYLDMQKGGESGITIYDVNGRLVKTIFKGGTLEKGTHKFTWDATDAVGKEVSSGSYFAVASTPQGKISRRLTLIR
jgi:hypothetical protein